MDQGGKGSVDQLVEMEKRKRQIVKTKEDTKSLKENRNNYRISTQWATPDTGPPPDDGAKV